MTAFSRQEGDTENGQLAWELRSVNHRFSEVSLRLPEECRFLEPTIREQIAKRINRGKIDATLRYQTAVADQQPLELDRALVERVAHATREIDQILYNAAPISALEVLRWPGVLKAPEKGPERLAADALALLDLALTELLDTRAREGEKLQAVIAARCDAIDEQVKVVESRLPEIQQAARARLERRLAEIAGELDPARLEQEIVLLANKSDVDEEIERLKAHVEEVRRVMTQDEPVGRRLDFLMQELNREANTLGSKSVHTDTTRVSVELKVLIEQMREQIQNIE
ncbi:MAG: YicC/YloC family endoribonuclease [Gammaproteobacteria bacterium]|nr:YicC/YloC family endoribonuclease [Gammaproteobacteria bacterium]